LATEAPLLLLKDLPKLAALGPRREGGRLAIRTAFRWASDGVSGVILETVLQGGQRYTTLLAVNRFFAAVTKARSGKCVAPRASSLNVRPETAAELTSELNRLGI